MPSTLLNGSSAQLNGMATPNGLPSRAWFEWGNDLGLAEQHRALVNIGVPVKVWSM